MHPILVSVVVARLHRNHGGVYTNITIWISKSCTLYMLWVVSSCLLTTISFIPEFLLLDPMGFQACIYEYIIALLKDNETVHSFDSLLW